MDLYAVVWGCTTENLYVCECSVVKEIIKGIIIWYDMTCDMIYDIYDMIWWYDMIYDMIYDMTWHGMIWYDMTWHGVIWYMIWYIC